MAEADRLLGMYLHLARASHLRQQPMVRAKLLVLAGVQAASMGLDEIAALCRHKVLLQNGRHLVRRWPTLAAALEAEGFQTYLKQLRRRYSREKIEHMVQSLGIVMAQERQAYFSDAEYAAALLDTPVESIAKVLAAPPSAGSPGGPPRAAQGSRSKPPAGRTALAAPPPARCVDDPAQPPRATARHLLIVWGPWAAGLATLIVLAVATLLR